MSKAELTTAPAPAQENPLALLGQMDLAKVEPDKLERLFDLQKDWEDRQARKAHAAALADFQSEMPQVGKGRDVQGKYRYASYDDIMKVARPILQRHGLAVSFGQVESGDTITVTCVLTHRDGHSTETPLTIPKLGTIQTRGGQDVTNLAQAMGSTLTYAKRYCLCNALDIVVTDEDDDAQAAGKGPTVDAATAERIDGLLGELAAIDPQGPRRFLDACFVETVEEIPASEAARAIKTLTRRLKQS